MDSFDKFNETQLPLKECFNSTLKIQKYLITITSMLKKYGKNLIVTV